MSFPARPLRRLTGHNGPVHCVTYSAGLGQYVLTGCTDRLIRLFNPSSTSLIQTYDAHGYEVLDIAVSDDNARFTSVGGDKQVFLWDVATARTLRRFAGHFGRVNAVGFGGEGGSVVVSGSFDTTIRIWDCKGQSTKPIQVLEDAKDSVSCLQVVGHEICAGSVDGRVRVYDLRMGMVYVDVIGHPITSLQQTKDTTALLLSTLDGTIRLMDKAHGTLLQAYKGHVNTEYRVRSCLGMNDTYVVSGSEDGRIFVWDLVEGKVVKTLEAEVDGEKAKGSVKRRVVSAVAVNDLRREWVSAGADGTAQIWGTE